MSDPRTLYVLTEDDRALADAVRAMFPPDAEVTEEPDLVDFFVPGRSVAVYVGDAPRPAQITEPARVVDVEGAGGGTGTAVSVATALRLAGFRVVPNPADPALVAADRARLAAAS